MARVIFSGEVFSQVMNYACAEQRSEFKTLRYITLAMPLTVDVFNYQLVQLHQQLTFYQD